MKSIFFKIKYNRNINKELSIKYLEEKYGLNHIISQSLISGNKKNYFNVELDEIVRSFRLEKPKPFVKLVGGKRQLLKQFIKLGLYHSFYLV